MKRIKVFTVFVFCFFIMTFVVSASNYRSGFNNYEIEVIDNLDLDISAEKIWNLTYNNSNKPVTVVKKQDKAGVAYIVKTKFFEVCYAANSKGFGATTVKRSWSTVPKQINDAVINSEEVSKQKCITPGKIDDKKALGLIASFLPNLLNDNYIHLLN